MHIQFKTLRLRVYGFLNHTKVFILFLNCFGQFFKRRWLVQTELHQALWVTLTITSRLYNLNSYTQFTRFVFSGIKCNLTILKSTIIQLQTIMHIESWVRMFQKVCDIQQATKLDQSIIGTKLPSMDCRKRAEGLIRDSLHPAYSPPRHKRCSYDLRHSRANSIITHRTTASSLAQLD